MKALSFLSGVGVNGIAILLPTLFDGQSTFELFFAKDSSLVEFDWL